MRISIRPGKVSCAGIVVIFMVSVVYTQLFLALYPEANFGG